MGTITIQQAAKLSSLSVSTIRNYIKDKRFKYELKKQGLKNKYEIDKQDFIKFCNENNIMTIEVF